MKNNILTTDEKIAFENEAGELIAQQVNEGYYNGLFDLEDTHGNYHSVSWTINIDIDFD